MADPADNLWTLLSSLAWPVAIGVAALCFRKSLLQISDALIHRFTHASEIKIGSFELKGQFFDPKGGNLPPGNDYGVVSATNAERVARNQTYLQSRHIMLVHKIRPSQKKNQVFDISIYLTRKIRQNQPIARFNEIDSVEYYLGDYFGGGKFGSKFIVRDPENGFAMQTSAYGPPLCIATIHFHDGTKAELSRFIDFEMGDVFDASNALKARVALSDSAQK